VLVQEEFEMGTQDITGDIEAASLRSFIGRLLHDLQALEMMIEQGAIESGVRRIGAEQELFLVDHAWRPAPLAMEILGAIDDPHFTTELGRFNLEINLDPRELGGNCLFHMEQELNALLARARAVACGFGADAALTGILPTMRKSDLGLGNMTPSRVTLRSTLRSAKFAGASTSSTSKVWTNSS
jgi:hypothetical protein